MKDIEIPPKEILDKLQEIDGYKGKRRYPFWKEQFEMLYKDIKAGKFGEDAKTGDFYKTIDKVVENAPKPSDPDKLKKELLELQKKHGHI